MSQFHSLQSNINDVDDWLEGKSAHATANLPQGGGDSSRIARRQDADVPPVPAPASPVAGNAALAGYYRTVSLPVRQQPGSFVSALQATMAPPVRREPVVIPATMSRSQAAPITRKLPERELHLHPRLRLGVVLILILLMLLLVTLSLTSLGNGQSEVPLVGGLIRWTQDEQMRMDIAVRHDGDAGRGATTGTTNQGPALPKSQYVAIAQAAAQKYGISPFYFVNQIQQESHFDPYAQSNAGAVGIAQFEPTTAASMGINPYDPVSALDGAARYMSQLQVQFGGDYAKALAAYNGGSGAVQAAVRNCGSAWLSCMPLQTQSYVSIVMR